MAVMAWKRGSGWAWRLGNSKASRRFTSPTATTKQRTRFEKPQIPSQSCTETAAAPGDQTFKGPRLWRHLIHPTTVNSVDFKYAELMRLGEKGVGGGQTGEELWEKEWRMPFLNTGRWPGLVALREAPPATDSRQLQWGWILCRPVLC